MEEQPIKEIPEETFQKALDIYYLKRSTGEIKDTDISGILSLHTCIAELYRIERNKQIAPTDEELHLNINTRYAMERNAAKWMREHFTEPKSPQCKKCGDTGICEPKTIFHTDEQEFSSELEEVKSLPSAEGVYSCDLHKQDERNDCDRFRFRKEEACRFCLHAIKTQKNLNSEDYLKIVEIPNILLTGFIKDTEQCYKLSEWMESLAALSVGQDRKVWEKEKLDLLENIMESFKGVHSDYHAEIVETLIQDLKNKI